MSCGSHRPGLGYLYTFRGDGTMKRRFMNVYGSIKVESKRTLPSICSVHQLTSECLDVVYQKDAVWNLHHSFFRRLLGACQTAKTVCEWKAYVTTTWQGFVVHAYLNIHHCYGYYKRYRVQNQRLNQCLLAFNHQTFAFTIMLDGFWSFMFTQQTVFIATLYILRTQEPKHLYTSAKFWKNVRNN